MLRAAGLATLLLALVPAPRAAAQSASAAVELHVTDAAGTPVPDVAAAIRALRTGGQTDAAGRLILRPLPAGRWIVELSRPGYLPRRIPIELRRNEQLTIPVELSLDTVQVQGIRVQAEKRSRPLESVGFYTRQKVGRGYFLPREELEKSASRPLSSVFRGIRGVQLERHSRQFPGSYRLALSRGTVSLQRRAPAFRDDDILPESCPVQYYLDGMPYALPTRGIDDIAVKELEAVEIYRGASEVPTEFNRTDATCGVVLLWTRKGP